MRPNTRAVYAESPGSLTFEITDLPALADAAHANGALLIVDNTLGDAVLLQAAGARRRHLAARRHQIYRRPFGRDVRHGVGGRPSAFPRLRENYLALGLCVGPDDIFLALRGLRTLGVRLERHMRSGLEVATFLAGRPEVAAVLHPALPTHPGHALWRRDMSGASGLFGVVLDGWSAEKTTPSSKRCSFSGSAIPGAASRASPSPRGSIARRPSGRPRASDPPACRARGHGRSHRRSRGRLRPGRHLA